MLKKIITADNTETFHNEEVDQTYHSATGAVEEALLKYVVPCQIEKKAQSGKLVILDVCFGLGYNSAMAIQKALEVNPNCKIMVIGLENDKEIIHKIQQVNPPIAFYQHYKKLTPTSGEFTHENVTIKILLGDATKTVTKIKDDFVDAIFFDPFSPKKHPHLWSVDLFKHMHRVMKKDAILATYSCARMVRDNMSAADLIWDNGPTVKRRGPGTIARKWVFDVA